MAPHRLTRARWLPVTAFLSVGTALALLVDLSVRYLRIRRFPGTWSAFPDRPWLDGWTRWDGGWYRLIAEQGYFFEADRPSPVAFFPLYPLLMRAGAALTGHVLVAGVAITAAAGLGASLLLHRWAAHRLAPAGAGATVAVLLLYPFAFFLYGAVYSDALFLFLVLTAFTLLEADRPALAGLAGALATATRPVGVALVAGLIVRALERPGVPGGPRGARDATGARGGPGRRRARLALRALATRDLGLLLAPLGLVAYCLFLWVRFGEPLAFVVAARAPAWEHRPGPVTWFKSAFFQTIVHASYAQRMLAIHFLLTVAAFALLPAVARRFGAGYAVYALVVLAIPAVSSKDFFGMGRYILAAFPCFAAAGDLLASRPRWRAAVLVVSGGALGVLTSLFARWYYVS